VWLLYDADVEAGEGIADLVETLKEQLRRFVHGFIEFVRSPAN
jgi:hypothetical protein